MLLQVSKRFGFLDAGKDPLKIISGLDDFLVYAGRVGVYPETHPIFFKLVSMLGANGFSHAAKFAADQVKAYKKNVEGETFLAKAIRIHQEQPHKISENDIFGICLMNVIAGSDTSSISLTSVIWRLLKNPHTLEKVPIKLHCLKETSANISHSCAKKWTRCTPAALSKTRSLLWTRNR